MIGPFSLKRWNSFSLSGVLGEALSSKTTRLLPQQSHLLSSLCLSKLYESCHLASAVSTGPTDHCNIFERYCVGFYQTWTYISHLMKRCSPFPSLNCLRGTTKVLMRSALSSQYKRLPLIALSGYYLEFTATPWLSRQYSRRSLQFCIAEPCCSSLLLCISP